MGKIKVKKSVKKVVFIIVVLGIFLSIGIYSYIKISNQKEYEQTNEYKLLQVGYNNDEINIILDKYKDKEIEYILNNELNTIYLELIEDKYFIYDSFYDYLEYLETNENITIRDAVENVNTLRNRDYYTDTIKTDISLKELMLVNKYYYLEADYEPENLVTISQTYAWGEAGYHSVISEVFDAYLNMWEEAKNAGFYLMISSSYRTYEHQNSLYNEYKDSRGSNYADSIAARPGHSEHQTGYTLDIFEKSSSNQKTFHETESYNWLKNNAHKYGFILRYPEDKEDITGYAFESWHYRYVGIEVATYIYENNITFDEYYAYYLTK